MEVKFFPDCSTKNDTTRKNICGITLSAYLLFDLDKTS